MCASGSSDRADRGGRRGSSARGRSWRRRELDGWEGRERRPTALPQGRRLDVRTVDKNHRPRLPLKGQTPEEPGEELSATSVGDNVPGSVKEIRAEGRAAARPQRYQPVSATG